MTSLITALTEGLSKLLALLGIEYLKFRRSEAENTDREKALKAALQEERKANEMDHGERIDDLSKWVRKSND